MATDDYFKTIGELKERYSIVKQFYEQDIKMVMQNYDYMRKNGRVPMHVDLSSSVVLGARKLIGRHLSELRTIKDALRDLKNEVNDRPKELGIMKLGSVKEKLNAILSENDVVTLSDKLKLYLEGFQSLEFKDATNEQILKNLVSYLEKKNLLPSQQDSNKAVSPSEFFKRLGDLKERYSVIKKQYDNDINELTEHYEYIQENRTMEYKYNVRESISGGIEEYGRLVNELESIKNELEQLETAVDNRPKEFGLFKFGNLKQKLHATLPVEKVVTLTRQVKNYQNAMVNIKDTELSKEKMIESVYEEVQSRSEIEAKHSVSPKPK